jgi:hypothetical protein
MTPAKIEKTSRRLASKKELAAWIDKTRDGLTWKEVLKEFTNSSAFHHRVQSIIDSVAGLSRS